MFTRRIGIRTLSVAIGTLTALACGGGGSDTHYVLDKTFHTNIFNNGPAQVTFWIDSITYTVAAGNHTNGTYRVRLEKESSTYPMFVEVKTPAGASLASKSYTFDYPTANTKDTLDINWDGTNISFNAE